MGDAATPGPGAPRRHLQVTVIHEGTTHFFSFGSGTKISAAKICAQCIPREPANDYVLALNEDSVFPEEGMPSFHILPRKLVVPTDDEVDPVSEKDTHSSADSSASPTISPNSSLRPGEAKEAQARLLASFEEQRRQSDASERSPTLGIPEGRTSGGGSRILRPGDTSPSPRVGSTREDKERAVTESAVKVVLKDQKAVVFKVERARAHSEPSVAKLQKDSSRENARPDLRPFDTTVLEPGSFEERDYDESPMGDAVHSSALPPIEASDECEVVVKEEEGKRSVVGGNVENLLLLFLQNADRESAKDFLYTYSYFTSSMDVFDRATRLFLSPSSYIIDDTSKNIFKSRIVAFFKFWIVNHFYAFQREDGILEAVTKWIDSLELIDPLHGRRYNIILKEALGKQVALTKPKNPSLVEAVGVAMQHPRTGILGSKKKYKDGKIDGADIVDWLMTNMRIKTRYEAEILGNHLLNQYLWATAGKRAPFLDTHTDFYALSKPKKEATGDMAEPEVKMIDKLKDPKQISILKLHPTELARQLTLLEAEIVKRIKPPEMMQSAWKKTNKKELAPGITELITWFNKINSWVATEIVMNQNVKHRAVIISRFIWTAEACRQIGNYNGVMEITSALHLGAIQQLKKTWKEVPEKDMEMFKELSALMNLTDNYRVYREEILKREKEKQPLVPYTGVFFQDFLIVEELPDRLANGIVNFQKMRRVAYMIGRLRRYQIRRFNFKPVRAIQEYLQQYTSVLSEADMYKWAKMCEGGPGTVRSPALTVTAPPPPSSSSGPLTPGSSRTDADRGLHKDPSAGDVKEVKSEAIPRDVSTTTKDDKKGSHSRSLSTGPSMVTTINPLRASSAIKEPEKKDRK